MKSDKRIWESLGASDPYFAVATIDKFHKGKLDEKAVDDFFESGREYVGNLWEDFARALGVDPKPKRALDFGCGVGRVLIALAERCETVVGVDISESMLAEARKNCASRGLTNFELVETEKFFQSPQTFDLVHSVIVLQHIDPKIGMTIIENLVGMLEAGGVGMLHVTYFDGAATLRKFKNRIYRRLPFLPKLANKVRGRENSYWSPMHTYDLNQVLKVLQDNGCHNVAVRFSDHGLLGAMIFFEKRALTKY